MAVVNGSVPAVIWPSGVISTHEGILAEIRSYCRAGGFDFGGIGADVARLAVVSLYLSGVGHPQLLNGGADGTHHGDSSGIFIIHDHPGDEISDNRWAIAQAGTAPRR